MRKTLASVAAAAYILCIGLSSAPVSGAQCKKNNTPSCGYNEVFNSCYQSCPPDTCSSIGRVYKCPEQPAPGDPKCKGKCVCKKDTYRNDIDQCVPEKQCNACPENQVYDVCIASCPPRTCNATDIYFSCTVQPQPGDPKCKQGCRCKDGFYKNDAGRCVTKNECHGCTKQNETWNPCPPEEQQTCENIERYDNASKTPETCKGQCVCEEGFYRNYLGECISKDNCLKCTGPNEYYSCGGACDNVCSTLSEQNQTNCPIVNVKCNEMCYCKDGYARNSKGECVLIAQCDNICDDNEVFDDCLYGCPPDTCDSIGIEYDCAAPPPRGEGTCRVGCKCKSGYYRNKAGKCVPPDQCDNCNNTPACGLNEVYNPCMQTCPPDTCESIGQKYNCPLQPAAGDASCNGGCQCKSGYYRNDAGQCISEKKCGQCPYNEYYNVCPSGCPPQTCDTADYQYKCVAPPQPGDPDCKPGQCKCKSGFYRNDKGQCVPKDQCHNCYGQYEEWNPCPPAENQTCENIERYDSCKNQTNPDCTGQCVCQDGYYRGRNGECISKENCLRCRGPHEYYACGGACDNVCSNLSEQNQTSCPIVNIKCNEMCYCEDGYARNCNNICVPYAQCKKEQTTNPGSNSSSCSADEVAAGKLLFNNGSNKFTANFHYELNKEKGPVSSIMSPYSLLFLLAQLFLYATGTCFDQLSSALNLNSKDQARCTFSSLILEINSATEVEFNLATKTYSTDLYPLSDAFKNDTRNVFQAEAQTLDFSDNEGSADIINAWVSNKTQGKITDIVPSSALSESTVAVLVNALYFKGLWQQPFNKNDTEESDFYKADGSVVKVQMMYQKGRFLYGRSDTLRCQILSMPYGNSGQFSLSYYLPDEDTTLSDLIDRMRDTTLVEQERQNMYNTSVYTFVPKMTLKTKIDLVKLLKQLNITQMFDRDDSGLVGIVQSAVKIFVSEAIQVAFIDVDEEGTVAAASNAVIVSATSAAVGPPERLEFRANRPFVTELRYKTVVGFRGCYTGDP